MQRQGRAVPLLTRAGGSAAAEAPAERGRADARAVGQFAGARLLREATAAVVESESVVALPENQFCFAGTKASSITTQQEVYKTVISCPVSALGSLLLLFAGCQWGFLLL